MITETMKIMAVKMLNEGNYRSSMLLFQDMHTFLQTSPSYPSLHPSDLLSTSNYLASALMTSSPTSLKTALHDTSPIVLTNCYALSSPSPPPPP
ncbi:hypothetical protein TrRE_jg12223, partial [Triparma retinervis]